MLLLLDFDGVLHPFDARHDPARQFVYLPRLEAVLRELPALHIVISSDWRERFSLDELQAYFSPDIAARVVGITPSISLDASSGSGWLGSRENEALAFMEATGQRWRWTALDDMPELWRSAIIACPDGFGAAQAERLRRWYEDQS